MTNLETIDAINKALSSHQFTITQASDWPMFLAMGGLLLLVFAGAWTIIVSLLVYGFKDIKVRISAQRAEDAGRCTDCKSAIWDHIAGPVWTAIEKCCPRLSEPEKDALRQEIKRKTGDCTS